MQSRVLAACLLLVGLVPAQDKPADMPAADIVVLKNGDRLTGTVKSLADGKLVFTSPAAGDVMIPLAEIQTLTTSAPVEVLTQGGETVKRRITGILGGQLQLEGLPGLNLDQLDKINPPPVKWTGSIHIGASVTSGNTNTRSATAQAEASRRTQDDRITAKAAWDYQEDKVAPGDWNLSKRKVQGLLQYDYFLDRRTYLFANTAAMGDTPADIDLRYTVNGGVGYQWVETAELKLSTELGAGWFYENYRSAQPTEDYMAVNAAGHLAWEFTKGVKLLDDLHVFPSLEDKDDVYLTNNLRVQLGLTGSMFVQAGWKLEYDNTPASGRERVDNTYTLSVGWSF
jgi:putative salt-induced outer membrane protein YdiY